MRSRTIVFGLLIFSVLGLWCAASAQDFASWATCTNKNEERAARIAACTLAIDSGKATTGSLAILLYNRGNMYLAGGAIKQALADFNRALSLDQKFVDAIISRGKTFMKNGEADRAVPDFDRAIRLNPNEAAVFRYRGLGYRQLGDYDKAILDYSSAIRLEPQNAKTYIDRGAVFYVKTYYYRALEDFDTALKLDPNYVEPLYGRGMARQKLGDAEGAADVAAAVAKQPNIAAMMAAAGVK
jgi:tetratricopeptide (TPR) repeat protein